MSYVRDSKFLEQKAQKHLVQIKEVLRKRHRIKNPTNEIPRRKKRFFYKV